MNEPKIVRGEHHVITGHMCREQALQESREQIAFPLVNSQGELQGMRRRNWTFQMGE